MIAIELFAGAGGLSLGLERAGFTVALANELESDFAKSYSINHPNTRILNCDIHEIDFATELSKTGLKYSDISLVSGGPPCQGFSTVGSKNKQDHRNSLFYEFLRAVDELYPPVVLFENVAGFKRLYEGEAFATLVAELKEKGYECHSALLDAADYGLPQYRKRTILVGCRKTALPFSFPPLTHGRPDLFGIRPHLCLIEAIDDLPELAAGEECDHYKCPPKNSFQKAMRGSEQLLTEHNASNYGEKMREILSLIPPGGSIGDLPLRLRPKNYFGNTYARLLPNQPSPTITRNFGTPSSSRCVHPFQERALSTREGARLQGFPDSYIFYGSKISKNLQIGNSVPPLLGEVVGKAIMRSLSREKPILFTA